VFSGYVWRTRSITASITQGSSIGSAAYTVTAADLRPLNPDNIFIKFADDTYLVISAANISTRAAEIDNIAAWAAENNRKLEKSKSKKVLFRDNRRRNLKTLPRSRFLALHSATTYQRQTTSALSSVRVRRRCMLCEYTAAARAVRRRTTGKGSGQS